MLTMTFEVLFSDNFYIKKRNNKRKSKTKVRNSWWNSKSLFKKTFWMLMDDRKDS